jgi:hypothetical protein
MWPREEYGRFCPSCLPAAEPGDRRLEQQERDWDRDEAEAHELIYRQEGAE